MLWARTDVSQMSSAVNTWGYFYRSSSIGTKIQCMYSTPDSMESGNLYPSGASILWALPTIMDLS